MLDKLDSLCNYAITNILILVSAYYVFYKWPKFLGYIADLQYKGKFFYNNIKNVSNKKKCCEKSCLQINKTTYLQVWEQFLAIIIIDAIVSVFYKTTFNAKLVFNLGTANFFTPFYPWILVFLFIIVYYKISE